ncbi:iron permease FTR1 [Synechococcales cyanobacterium C]|uniref:Iron permease FTR1 n=1 Tax=Petrachloros mirabilis ULC683 TaxID=2781853 RepID=A0A8K1ZZX1_9CYAN|nr:FTR1 family protein [Petrachloros mirabilis]NCJ07016.1 iron permease FTR1 [Petrachloros mirabilis ULC683]
MDWSLALPTFLITLREGVEAALVVGIVLACLQQSQHAHLKPWVYLGMGAGVLMSLALGGLLQGSLWGLQSSKAPYASFLKQLFEAGVGSLAIVMLSWMLLWMTRQARAQKLEIEGSVQSALKLDRQAAWGIFSLIFVAVLREGIETVLFVVAQFQGGWMPVWGAVAGLSTAVVLGYLLFGWGIRINLRRFFQVMGVLLLLIVSGLAISVLRHVDGAAIAWQHLHPQAHLCPPHGRACLLGPQVWDLSKVLPDRQFPGILLKTLVGYTQQLYVGQALVYVIFWLTLGRAYFRSLQPTSPAPQTPQVSPES